VDQKGFCINKKMGLQEDRYEMVVGLEVHAQLLTKTKLFCGDSAVFGAEPNTHVSPITLGHPGVLPVLNRKAVELAVKMGLACHCAIERHNYFARKNYFYPDLPKGYQITQHTTPICVGGFIRISAGDGERKIQLNRIHLEEDAGKSLHDLDPANSAVDYNRAGVPLIEIVTEPVIKSSGEAYAFLTELRKILRYTEVCDGNMEEGSMRCDANVSIRLKGENKLGTKVEVKNLNSIRNVKRAIEFEKKRLISLVENGEEILQETRGFDASQGTTFALRSKEDANDYRYFADPDLTPFNISESFLEEIRKTLPALPEELVEKYTTMLGLSEYDARLLCDDRETSLYFDRLARETSNYKAAANWVTGPIKSWLNEQNLSIKDFPLDPGCLAKLIGLVDDGRVNFSVGSTRILPHLIKNPGEDPLQIAIGLNLVQNSDSRTLLGWVEEVLAKMPDKVAEYKKGKKGLMALFVGEVKKISKGKADLRLTGEILDDKLNHS
jgi:aspartyl-tRNA(Asn)/glutamyl-tRNA(Gln) amidotransferase subunit B